MNRVSNKKVNSLNAEQFIYEIPKQINKQMYHNFSQTRVVPLILLAETN